MIRFGVSTHLAFKLTGLTEEKSSDDSSENNSDTDYFADVETSSIDSSELSRSTSVDDTSEPSSRGGQNQFLPILHLHSYSPLNNIVKCNSHSLPPNRQN